MPKTRPPYPAEFREEAVRLALTRGKRTSEIAADLGVSYESLRKWIKQHQVDGGNAPGVTSVEPLNRFEIYLLNTVRDAARFVDAVGVPGCGVLYDSFHANIEEKSVAEAIAAGRSTINHVHISENDRSTPGAGAVDWDKTLAGLKELGYDGWLTIEAFGQALPALIPATKIWRRMYATEEQLARDGLAFIRRRWEAA